MYIPAGTLVAGRGGVTKTGARVYSETDQMDQQLL